MMPPPESRLGGPNISRLRPKPISLKELGHQHQHTSQLAFGIPQYHLYRLRNNLCAYSQVHNLLFVADGSEIHVYDPTYPDQTCSAASLVVITPASNPLLRGHMPGDHHGINHLHVASLGDQEIVVCACDDGDAYAYYTNQIDKSFAKLKKQLDRSKTEVPIDEDLHPFFHVNVGASAWGVAVHSEARMIAISCNSHNVYVYALALVSEPDSSVENEMTLVDEMKQTESLIARTNDDETDNTCCYDTDGNSESYNTRGVDKKFVLQGHKYNIPSIAFCNTPEDCNGRFLISTDISGQTFMWDILQRKPVLAMQHVVNDEDEDYEGDLEVDLRWAGWALLWIDRRAFERAYEARHAFGEHSLILRTSEAPIVDATKQRQKIRNNGPWNSENISNDFTRVRRGTSNDITGPVQEHSDSDGGSDSSLWNADDMPGSTECMMHNYEKLPTQYYRGPSEALPSSPFILAHGRNINLFQPFSYDYSEWGTSPVVHMFDPLRQETDIQLHRRIAFYDRMYLQAQIPELGVILLASQKGRVAVLTLHIDRSKPQIDQCTQSMYGFRLNHILPFSSQEKQKLRPDFPLVGLSTGPIKGSEDKSGRFQRYRIALTYSNRTMLTYEIGKDQESSGGWNSDVLMI